MINATKQKDGSWIVTITKNGLQMQMYFVGGSKSEIMKAARRELTKAV